MFISCFFLVSFVTRNIFTPSNTTVLNTQDNQAHAYYSSLYFLRHIFDRSEAYDSGPPIKHQCGTTRLRKHGQSRDSPLVRDWLPGLLGFASVEDKSVRGIVVEDNKHFLGKFPLEWSITPQVALLRYKLESILIGPAILMNCRFQWSPRHFFPTLADESTYVSPGTTPYLTHHQTLVTTFSHISRIQGGPRRHCLGTNSLFCHSSSIYL